LLPTKKRVLKSLRGWERLFVWAVLFAYGCAPSVITQRGRLAEPPETVRARQRFEEAQRLAERQAYSEALSIYRNYLESEPGGPLADTALMKSGLVLMAAGRYGEGREAFQRLLLQYPESPFCNDARFNMVLAYYTEGDFESAVRYGESALTVSPTGEQESRIRNLMGHVYVAAGEFQRAFESYVKAYESSRDEDKPEILSKVKDVVSYLDEQALLSLLDKHGGSTPGGYLRLQLARGYAAEGLTEAAMAVLYEVLELFPEHEETKTAQVMLEELRAEARVDRYLIGCILPLSGRYAEFGNRAMEGIELALNEFNALPDVHPVELAIRDSKGDPDDAVRALENLVIEEGVIGIIGPMVTSPSVAARAQALRVPIITLTQKPDITATGDYVFRNYLTLELQTRALVRYAVQDLGLRRFAVLYPDEPYGVTSMHRFWDELLRYGAEVVGVESYGPDETDFRDCINKLVGLYYPRLEEPSEEVVYQEPDESNEVSDAEEGADGPSEPQTLPEGPGVDDRDMESPEGEDEGASPIVNFQAIFIPDGFEKTGLIAPQLMYHDVTDVLLLGTNLWHSDKLIEIAGNYVEGAVIPDGFFADSPSPRVQQFVERFNAAFERPPAFLEAQAYDTARIFFGLVNTPEVRSRLALKTALLGLRDFPGVTGRTAFDETGDVDKELYLLTVKGARFVQIKP
jgi:branched-chain amino acid transport system substrate-binding protein